MKQIKSVGYGILRLTIKNDEVITLHGFMLDGVPMPVLTVDPVGCNSTVTVLNAVAMVNAVLFWHDKYVVVQMEE